MDGLSNNAAGDKPPNDISPNGAAQLAGGAADTATPDALAPDMVTANTVNASTATADGVTRSTTPSTTTTPGGPTDERTPKTAAPRADSRPAPDGDGPRRGEAINLVLRSLPAADLVRLQPRLEAVSLSTGQILYLPGEAARYGYFVNAGLVSLVLGSSGGLEVEVSVVGREGLVGANIILGNDRTINEAVVQVPGHAWRASVEVLEAEFKRGGALQERLLAYVHALLAQSTQLALCSHVHTPQERLSRWLLMVSDSIQADAFDLSVEFLAKMIGSDAHAVAATTDVLRRADLVEYANGRITILNRQELEESTCDCYALIRDEYHNLSPHYLSGRSAAV